MIDQLGVVFTHSRSPQCGTSKSILIAWRGVLISGVNLCCTMSPYYRRTGFYCEVKSSRMEVCRSLCESNCCDRPPDHYYYRLHDVFLANLIIAGYTGTRKLAIIGLPQ